MLEGLYFPENSRASCHPPDRRRALQGARASQPRRTNGRNTCLASELPDFNGEDMLGTVH
jgi:hypothetical protein